MNKFRVSFVPIALLIFTSHTGWPHESSKTGKMMGDIVDKRVPIPDQPQNGVQIVLPETVIPAMDERQVCAYMSLNNANPQMVTGYHSFQNQDAGGHHLIAFITNETKDSKPDGTIFDCTMGAPKGSQFLLFPLNDSRNFQSPPGYGISIPANARFVFQFHYHNHSPNSILVRDVMNIEYASNPSQLNAMAPFLTAIVDFRVPAHTKHIATYECPILNDLDLYSIGGHIHESGMISEIELVRNNIPQQLYVQDWKPEYAMHPLVNIYSDQHLSLKRGDTLRVHCVWDNQADQEAAYPAEMCGTVGFHVSGPESVVCSYFGGKAYYQGSTSGK